VYTHFSGSNSVKEFAAEAHPNPTPSLPKHCRKHSPNRRKFGLSRRFLRRGGAWQLGMARPKPICGIGIDWRMVRVLASTRIELPPTVARSAEVRRRLWRRFGLTATWIAFAGRVTQQRLTPLEGSDRVLVEIRSSFNCAVQLVDTELGSRLRHKHHHARLQLRSARKKLKLPSFTFVFFLTYQSIARGRALP
jgi:hypothetical protein